MSLMLALLDLPFLLTTGVIGAENNLGAFSYYSCTKFSIFLFLKSSTIFWNADNSSCKLFKFEQASLTILFVFFKLSNLG